ncbi:MAG: heparinase II/III family protein [Spirochaetales bacterium]|nr:heparinase II/III family protein [Spirochaetales bacterium]
MNYLNQDLLGMVKENHAPTKDFLKNAAKEADTYFENFKDDPSAVSVWAHHYFCKEEGGLLIYNPETPEKHVCSICGKEYNNELLNGAWITMYRNSGAVNAWKAATLYKAEGDKKYLNYLIDYLTYYAENYSKFLRHNKDGLIFQEGEQAKWGVSRIMPQNLNEGIWITRVVNALEIVKEDLSADFIKMLEEKLFTPAFEMLKPQVHKVHNIPCWLDCTIGAMGLFLGRDDMVDFAFNGELSVNKQLEDGVTADFFWYEGSIHYNSFLLEGLVNLLLFTEIYGYDFAKGKEIIKNMLLSLYDYAFDDHRLPNPNDGWPDVNLKTYSYIYAMATRVFGEDSEIGKRLCSIVTADGERGTIPLSRPYYFKNDVSLEELLFTPALRYGKKEAVLNENRLFPASYCGMIGSGKSSVFLKYGHNGPSHAHPDKMTLEFILDGTCVSRDLSNSGYGNVYCNEWHRVTASHNTVMVNGENQNGFEGGECLTYEADRIHAKAENVYPGTTYERDLKIGDKDLSDSLTVTLSEESVCDYFFHVEGAPEGDLGGVSAEIGYETNGYQHLSDVVKIPVDGDTKEIVWTVGDKKVSSIIDVADAELYMAKSPDNPVVNYRTSIIVRKKGKSCQFTNNWKAL